MNRPDQPADPHPANEEHGDRQRHPGGAHPPKNDLGPNPAIHDGEPRRPPDDDKDPDPT